MSRDERVALATQQIMDVIGDPAASYWLRDVARSAIARDPVDAVNDASCLLGLLKPWAAAINEAATPRTAA
jgi:hypothetical protein